MQAKIAVIQSGSKSTASPKTALAKLCKQGFGGTVKIANMSLHPR